MADHRAAVKLLEEDWERILDHLDAYDDKDDNRIARKIRKQIWGVA
jgi:uncharacterized protein (DUF1778 family)